MIDYPFIDIIAYHLNSDHVTSLISSAIRRIAVTVEKESDSQGRRVVTNTSTGKYCFIVAGCLTYIGILSEFGMFALLFTYLTNGRLIVNRK